MNVTEAQFIIVAFPFFFVASAIVYGVALCFCAIISPQLRVIVRKQSWLRLVLVAATSAALLMLFSIRIGEKVIEDAKKARTANEAREIQTAILGYYTEYSEMPPSTDNASLIKILTGNNPRYNPRGIAFISMSPRDINAKGEMVDAWQQPFRIFLADPDHPAVISDPPPAQ